MTHLIISPAAEMDLDDIWFFIGQDQIINADRYIDHATLTPALVLRPDMGDLIKGSGGLRKVRWSLEGRGKSGGVRAIYYWVTDDDHIRMLYVYPKGKQENLTPSQVKQLKAIVERW